jgi:hypothetical protein
MNSTLNTTIPRRRRRRRAREDTAKERLSCLPTNQSPCRIFLLITLALSRERLGSEFLSNVLRVLTNLVFFFYTQEYKKTDYNIS